MWRLVAFLALVVGPTWAADFPNYFGPIAVSGTSGGGGGGSQTTPGGVTNSVQTNNGTTNSLGGDSSLLYTTGLLNLTGTLSATTLSATTLSLGGVITNGQVLYLSGTVVDGAAGQNYNRLVDRTFFDEAPAGIATLYTPSTTVLISNSLAVTSFTQIGFSPSRTVTAALEVSGTISGSVILGARGNFGATTATSGTLNVSGTTPIAIYGGGAGVYHTLGESGVGKLTIKGWNSTSTVDVVDLTGGLSARFYGSGSTSFNGFCVNGGAGCPTALTRDLTFITAGNGAISGSLALGKLTSATTGNILEAVGIISSTGLTVAGPVTATTANFSGAITVASCTGCGGGGGGGTSISTTTFTAASNISNNTVIGYNTTGGTGGLNNTILGASANSSLTTNGNNNTLIGSPAAMKLTTGGGNTVIGSNVMTNETTGGSNVVIGGNSMNQANGQNNSVAVGYNSCSGATNGSNNICLGSGLSVVTAAGSNQLNLGGAIYGDITSAAASGLANLIGINNTAPTASLEVSGTVKFDNLTNAAGTGPACYSTSTKQITTNTAACTVSDMRLKKNVEPYNGSLDKVMQLDVRQFDFRDPKTYGAQHQVGLIAQEVEKVIPAVVGTGDDGLKLKSVSYDKLSAYAIGAIQEQQAEINELRRALNLAPAHQTFWQRIKWLAVGI